MKKKIAIIACLLMMALFAVNVNADEYDDGIFKLTYNSDYFYVDITDGGTVSVKAINMPDDNGGHNTVLGCLSEENKEYYSLGELSSVDLKYFKNTFTHDVCTGLFEVDNGISVAEEGYSYSGEECEYFMTLSDGTECYTTMYNYGETVYYSVCRLCPYTSDLNDGYREIYKSIHLSSSEIDKTDETIREDSIERNEPENNDIEEKEELISNTDEKVEIKWSDTLMSKFFVLEPDKKIELTDGIELNYYNIVIHDKTNNWRLVLTEDEFDIYDYFEEYYKVFEDDAKDGRIHCLIYCADDKEKRTTTCIRLSEKSIDATVHKYVSGEAGDANLMFTGDYIKERVADIDSGIYFDYDTGESGNVRNTNKENISTESDKSQKEPTQNEYNNSESEAEIAENVWISENGTKYHRKSSCSNMESPKEVGKSEAAKMGYTQCKKCY